MKLKILAAALAVSGVFVALYFFKKAPEEMRDFSPAQSAVSNETGVVRNEYPLAKVHPGKTDSPNQVGAQTNSTEEIMSELEQLGARSDDESFQKIIAHLRDENPEIRQAALDATIQFGNRAAIPVLQKIAAQTENNREKIRLLEAAEYLDMPSLSEIRGDRRFNTN